MRKTIEMPFWIGDKVRDLITDHVFEIRSISFFGEAYPYNCLIHCGNKGTDDYAVYRDNDMGKTFALLEVQL